MILDYMLAHTPLVLMGLTLAAVVLALAAITVRRMRRAAAERGRRRR